MVIPGNKQRLPESLRRVNAIKPQFDHARDPLISAQLRDREKTESQHRKAQGRGSSMVRTDRPFPELRPKRERGPKRAAVDQAWLREQRAAVMAQMEVQPSRGVRASGRSRTRSAERFGGPGGWSR